MTSESQRARRWRLAVPEFPHTASGQLLWPSPDCQGSFEVRESWRFRCTKTHACRTNAKGAPCLTSLKLRRSLAYAFRTSAAILVMRVFIGSSPCCYVAPDKLLFEYGLCFFRIHRRPRASLPKRSGSQIDHRNVWYNFYARLLGKKPMQKLNQLLLA